MVSNLDSRLNIPKLDLGPLNLTIAIILVLSGFSLGFWSVLTEFIKGEGTPAPIMPTQRLIITGPFKYCRNPMAFGAICAYLGVVVYTGSLSSFILYAILVTALLLYIKLVEEKELEARFGQEYLEYKKRVPFMMPRRR